MKLCFSTSIISIQHNDFRALNEARQERYAAQRREWHEQMQSHGSNIGQRKELA